MTKERPHVDLGPKPSWVKARWLKFDGRDEFKVSCSRCGGSTFASRYYVEQHPEEPGKWAEQHNKCEEKP